MVNAKQAASTKTPSTGCSQALKMQQKKKKLFQKKNIKHKKFHADEIWFALVHILYAIFNGILKPSALFDCQIHTHFIVIQFF